jgi:hypothetical protein
MRFGTAMKTHLVLPPRSAELLLGAIFNAIEARKNPRSSDNVENKRAGP